MKDSACFFSFCALFPVLRLHGPMRHFGLITKNITMNRCLKYLYCLKYVYASNNALWIGVVFWICFKALFQLSWWLKLLYTPMVQSRHPFTITKPKTDDLKFLFIVWIIWCVKQSVSVLLISVQRYICKKSLLIKIPDLLSLVRHFLKK